MRSETRNHLPFHDGAAMDGEVTIGLTAAHKKITREPTKGKNRKETDVKPFNSRMRPTVDELPFKDEIMISR